ncbi:3-oxoacyl-ACP reductase family protein [Caballeronia insecticola]|uniref:Putative short-chain dehydrogenase n=1 Tax=Caballeronia insecticola TaxID=758793 RepID=R4X4H3_9BURK|nr:3-oxoacyl-ACP reductase family protein [Caballeronia insecticola]BAN28231.1 putative short-chain dehydrogenase [Caballeronia insecticola]
MFLKSKRAIVTGASRGIGTAIARKLASEGADVVITYEKSAQKAGELVQELRSFGVRATAIQANSANPDDIVRSISEAREFLGGIDVLVNNAGIIRVGPLESMPLQDIDAMLGVNIRGPILTTQAVIPHLGRGGRIITIGSFFANNVYWPGLTVYSTSKSALTSFTRGLSRELGARDITVNLIQPGAIDTDMNPASGDFAAVTKPMIPSAQYGKGDDIANAVAFLASEQASYINGATLTVDGGLTA